MATPYQQVIARAKELGAEVYVYDRNPSRLEVDVHAPGGHIWTRDGGHHLGGNTDDVSANDAVWSDLLDDMNGGLEFCMDRLCDHCNGRS